MAKSRIRNGTMRSLSLPVLVLVVAPWLPAWSPMGQTGSQQIPCPADAPEVRKDEPPAKVKIAEDGPASSDPVKPSSDSFARLRRPLFGFAIEFRSRDAAYRLVRVRHRNHQVLNEVLHEGSLDSCEEKLIASLKKKIGTGNFNIPFPTFGGKQFWSDRMIYCGWRIQVNSYTGHYRLLDSSDTRRAWGSYRECRVALEENRVALKLEPASRHVVLLLHGLFRSKDSFTKLKKALEAAGYDVASVNYPSTKRSIDEHARQITVILGAMAGYERVSFVTHSLGGIVVRKVLASKNARWRKKLRPHRLVMLAPPNKGSIMADILKDWMPYKLLAGKSGQELTPDEVSKIPEPSCEFGIIAGGDGSKDGKNPLLPGDDDGTVLVENTRLPSMKDFLLVDAVHSFIMSNEKAIAATVRFLKVGKFEAAAR